MLNAFMFHFLLFLKLINKPKIRVTFSVKNLTQYVLKYVSSNSYTNTCIRIIEKKCKCSLNYLFRKYIRMIKFRNFK